MLKSWHLNIKKKITLYFDKQNKVEKYVAANVLVGSINYKKLCDEVNQRTGVHRSMVDVVLKGVQDVMIAYLEEGFSVKLDEFGARSVRQSMPKGKTRKKT